MSVLTPRPPKLFASHSPRLDTPKSREWHTFWRRWWPLFLGLSALLGSTGFRFSQSFWQQADYEHGPFLCAAALWLMWRERAFFLAAVPPKSASGPALFLIPGLLIYLFGVRVKAGFLEFGSLVPILIGAIWLIGGQPLVRRTWFALLLLLLAMPLPANIIIAATAGLKEWVSGAAEAILHLAGYPIARNGVTLRVGPYNLLLADACAGMNSLISLTALGLFYLHITTQRTLWHAAILAGSIVPIAIATNVARVVILSLITFYLGDQAGQGFLHDFAGLAIFAIALTLLMLEDAVLRRAFVVRIGPQNARN